MSIPLAEQETIINFSRDEEFAYIWTSDSTVMTKLDKRVDSGDYELIDTGKDTDGNLLSKEYRCLKRLVSFRSKKVSRELTDEQKHALADRLRKTREVARSQNQI